ncbi:MAG TPA: hypothetical protein VG637_10780 [Actinomycetes bacterium]|nr:hypothetical protein [Actinomycetes bacterium]
MALDGGHVAVGEPAGDDEHLPGTDLHLVAALQPDREPARQAEDLLTLRLRERPVG